MEKIALRTTVQYDTIRDRDTCKFMMQTKGGER